MRYIYITTNEINGKRYIGQRKCPKGKTPKKDIYLGSGNLLIKAIKKYGKENFTKEILFYGLNQEEADILEIYEIKLRDVLNKKDMWYNLDAGGQYNRAEEHSEITSKAMKDFYATNKGKEAILKILNVKRIAKGIPEYKTVTEWDISKHNKKIKSKIKKFNRRYRSRINNLCQKLNKNPIEIDKAKQSENAKSAYLATLDKYPDIKERRANGIRKAHDEARSNGTTAFSNETRIKFGLAKCRSANNKLGEYILMNYDIKYSMISSKVKKVTKGDYKDESNRIIQLEKIREIIIVESSKDICLVKMIELTRKSRSVAV